MIYIYGTQEKDILCNCLGGIDIPPFFVNEINSLKNDERVDEKCFESALDYTLLLYSQWKKTSFFPIELIRKTNPHTFVLLIDKPKHISEEMKKRFGIEWSEEYIEELQYQEINYIRKISGKLKVNYKIIINSNKVYGNFGQSIILPIKPIYAERIISGEKKYEYRKKICKNIIDKIYIYETAPVKKIIGECDVIGMISMEKAKVWNATKADAGISKSEFEQYFQKEDIANTYVIDNPRKYKKAMTLADRGIDYIVQSYTYVHTEEQL